MRSWIHRGDIFYIAGAKHTCGSEQSGYRPGIIVSNQAGNKFSPVVEVVFLTMEQKTDLPTHVAITSSPKPSTAICEQPTPVSVQRLKMRIGHATKEEMERIDLACAIGLNLENLEFKWKRLKEQEQRKRKALEGRIAELEALLGTEPSGRGTGSGDGSVIE